MGTDRDWSWYRRTVGRSDLGRKLPWGQNLNRARCSGHAVINHDGMPFNCAYFAPIVNSLYMPLVEWAFPSFASGKKQIMP